RDILQRVGILLQHPEEVPLGIPAVSPPADPWYSHSGEYDASPGFPDKVDRSVEIGNLDGTGICIDRLAFNRGRTPSEDEAAVDSGIGLRTGDDKPVPVLILHLDPGYHPFADLPAEHI